MDNSPFGSEKRERDWLPRAVRAAGVRRVLKPGEYLFRIDARAVGLYEVIAGRIKLARIDPSGRETVLHIAGPGDTVAEASLFSPAYQCDAIAITDAIVQLYPKALLLAAFHENPRAMRAFVAMLARQVMNLRTRLERRNIQSAPERIRHYLVLNVGPDRHTVTLPGTLKDLANELGLAHEALYRTLAAMAARGEIERFAGKIRLKNPAV